MKDFKFLRVMTAKPDIRVADLEINFAEIRKNLIESPKEVDIIVFPELCIPGAGCQDLFLNEDFINGCDRALTELCNLAIGNRIIVVGSIEKHNDNLYNTAFVIQNNKILGKIRKQNLRSEEKRWFSEGKNQSKIFCCSDCTFSVVVGEDILSPSFSTKAKVVLNPSAFPLTVGCKESKEITFKEISTRYFCSVVNSNITTELGDIKIGNIQDIDLQLIGNRRRFNLFDNDIDNFNIINFSKQFLKKENDKIYRHVEPFPFKFVPEEILEAQVDGLSKRLEHTKMKPIIGVSGGSDSTWALIVIIEALKRLGRPVKDCIGVSLPGFATSERTRLNALRLMKELGIDAREIDIKEVCKEELKALGHDGVTQDITYENVQARMRTSVLMNLANTESALVIGTGDLSELALGWCTYNADQMSMYSVNAGVPKTIIKKLISNYAEENDVLSGVLNDILDTPVSPELTGNGAESQQTEDKIGPYELHEFFLYNLVYNGFGKEKIIKLAEIAWSWKYSEDEIKKYFEIFIKRFFNQQFKRSCSPDSPKIYDFDLSPNEWKMSSESNNFML